MFDISLGENDRVILAGRFDASQVEKAENFFSNVEKSIIIDFGKLEYISSAGLGILLAVNKKLSDLGNHVKLVNMNEHIRDIFRYAGFDKIFEIE